MSLTAAQAATLKPLIQANTASVTYNGSSIQIGTLFNLTFDGGAMDIIAAWYNLLSAVDFWVWRSALSEDEAVGSIGVDVANGNAATSWSWVGTGFITRAQGERDCWARLFRSGFCNPSLSNVRQAFSDIISGATAPAPANRNHLLVLAKRKATNVEKALATGTGTFASPANMGYENSVNGTDILLARNS